MNKICCLHFLQCLLLGATQDCVFNEDSEEYNFGRVCCRSDGLPSDKDLITGTKICCNGTLHDRGGQQCCNGELYDPEEKTCCGSELHTRPLTPHVCCGGVIHLDSTPATLGCCGGMETYNGTTQICCEYNGSFSVASNNNRDCCYDKDYDISTEHCVSDLVLRLGEDLCGRTVFNTSSDVCCNVTLHAIPTYPWKCCGENVYDVNSLQCCKAFDTTIPKSQTCCGEDFGTNSTEICCNGVAHPKEASMTCCGTGRVDNVTTGCCAAKPYNTTTHQCSNEKIESRRADNDCDQRTHPCNTKQTGLKSGIVLRSGVCRACMKNVKYVSKQIRKKNWTVCKQFNYTVKVNSPAVPSGRFWIMRGKLLNDEGNEKVVRLIVPCKCCKLNKTEQFVLLTDTAIQGRTVRLGDGDLLLPRDQRLMEDINQMRNQCRNAGAGSSWFVQQLKERAIREVGQFIDRILPRTKF